MVDVGGAAFELVAIQISYLRVADVSTRESSVPGNQAGAVVSEELLGSRGIARKFTCSNRRRELKLPEVTFIPVDHMNEVLEAALDRTPVPRSKRRRTRAQPPRGTIAQAKSRQQV
jgi:hypothetical protein